MGSAALAASTQRVAARALAEAQLQLAHGQVEVAQVGEIGDRPVRGLLERHQLVQLARREERRDAVQVVDVAPAAARRSSRRAPSSTGRTTSSSVARAAVVQVRRRVPDVVQRRRDVGVERGAVARDLGLLVLEEREAEEPEAVVGDVERVGLVEDVGRADAESGGTGLFRSARGVWRRVVAGVRALVGELLAAGRGPVVAEGAVARPRR